MQNSRYWSENFSNNIFVFHLKSNIKDHECGSERRNPEQKKHTSESDVLQTCKIWSLNLIILHLGKKLVSVNAGSLLLGHISFSISLFKFS
jgi:hypothetical protein